MKHMSVVNMNIFLLTKKSTQNTTIIEKLGIYFFLLVFFGQVRKNVRNCVFWIKRILLGLGYQ